MDEAKNERQLTFGERAVGLSFNPSQDPKVQKIKEEFAQIIDTLNDYRAGNPGDEHDPDLDSTQGDSNAPSSPPINTIEEILNKVLMVWKQDYPKPKGNSLDMDGYFERLEQSKIEATQAISTLITQARIEGENKKAFRDIEIALKTGFYAGQAMARVELEDCHTNWKKWNSNEELQNEQ